jgi:hypothetical protein
MSCGESDGNATTWIFNMKNRFGWHDKQQVDNISSDGSMTPVGITVTFHDPDKSG